MNLADKPCYPIIKDLPSGVGGSMKIPYIEYGLTFRERLIIALASNPIMIKQDSKVKRINADLVTNELYLFPEDSARMIIQQADAIIKELEK